MPRRTGRRLFLFAAALSAALLVLMSCRDPALPPAADRTQDPLENGADAPPQKVYTINMPGPAAAHLETRELETPSTTLHRSIRRRFPRLGLDPCLERAAEAYAHGLRTFHTRPPLDFTEFVLHWAGCPDPTAAVITVLTEDPGPGPGLDLLAEAQNDSSFSHAGLVRTKTGGDGWQWVAVLVAREFALRPLPSRVEPGAAIPMVFRLSRSFSKATLYVTRPRGQIHHHRVGLGGGWAVASLPVGDEIGRCWVELLAEDEQGPQVLALFPVAVGREPPSVWVGEGTPDESWISSPEKAEAYLRELVNRDRETLGLAPLTHDPVLDRIARAHSRDMAEGGFFAHVSPTTGDISDRLSAAAYRTRVAMENLASASSLAEAQEGLMRSPGHRAAILSPQVTHLGTGVVRTGEGNWLLTQVFSRPLLRVSADELAASLEEAVRDRRRRLVRATQLEPALSRLALELASDTRSGEDILNLRSDEIGRRVAEILPTASGWQGFAGRAYNLEDIELPAMVDQERNRRFGIAVAPVAENAAHNYVVLILY